MNDMNQELSPLCQREAVHKHYEAFPFPPVECLVQEDTSRDLRASANLELRLTGPRAMRPGGKAWVPGCGTRWAVMLALQLRDMEVLGTDISQESLALQGELARSLDLRNLTLERADLLEASPRESFDLISCVGVLHHLPDPAEGLRVITKRLRPTGVLELMVYDRYNRQYSQRMQEILRVLDPDYICTANERFLLATRVLRALNTRANVPRELRRVLRLLDQDQLFHRDLADYISQPVEHVFDIPSLLAMLSASGLAVRSFKMPHRFAPELMLDDAELQVRATQLDPGQRAHLGHLLGTGLLELFVEHAEAPQSASSLSLDARLVRASGTGLHHQLDANGCVRTSTPYAKLVRQAGTIYFDGGERRPLVESYGVDLDCVKAGQRRLLALTDLGFATDFTPEELSSLIEASVELAKEPLTLQQLGVKLAREHPGRPIAEIVRILDQLCRTPFRVLSMIDI